MTSQVREPGGHELLVIVNSCNTHPETCTFAPHNSTEFVS
ncbi:hypothetical protein HMPREF9948_2508 [Propionibacterium sp. 434-HC2]|nr:hypothetical protein HMPREF9599_02270 [Cutibacterium acnes HL050PA2]EGL43255.1 hypothetical protein HMPREF9948_2508 [Propionibacterium sp. 434-HC2]